MLVGHSTVLEAALCSGSAGAEVETQVSWWPVKIAEDPLLLLLQNPAMQGSQTAEMGRGEMGGREFKRSQSLTLPRLGTGRDQAGRIFIGVGPSLMTGGITEAMGSTQIATLPDRRAQEGTFSAITPVLCSIIPHEIKMALALLAL